MFARNAADMWHSKKLVVALAYGNDVDEDTAGYWIDNWIAIDPKLLHATYILLQQCLALPHYQEWKIEQWKFFDKARYSPKAYVVDDTIFQESISSIPLPTLHTFKEIQQKIIDVLSSECRPDALLKLVVGSILSLIQETRVKTITEPSFEEIHSLLQRHLLFPLKAIHALHCSFHNEDLNEKAFETISQMSKALLEGNYQRWRKEISSSHFRYLNEIDINNWDFVQVIDLGVVSTTEESGLGLFWIPKVGGPSHGFDLSPSCYLPLICNDSMHSIALFEDNGEFPIARAHLRFLYAAAPSPQSEEQDIQKYTQPVLYLENKQVDFEYRETENPIPPEKLAAFIVFHALKKAALMNWSLSINKDDWCALQSNFVEHVDKWQVEFGTERFLIPASAGIFEASDSLGNHDWIHTTDALSIPSERVRLTPK